MHERNSNQNSWYKKESQEDVSLRPLSLESFVGQTQLKKNLKLFIDAAKQRHESLDHVFFSGGPGLGKTTLSCIIANELKVDIRVTSAPAIDKPRDLVGILTTLTEHSVLFIDEIHRLKPVIEEILYVAMEDFMLDWVIGSGADARTVRVPLCSFTLVGATTQPGKISNPLHSRFGIRERLDMYTHEDIQRIIVRSASILNTSIVEDTALFLANMSRGNPRYANRLIRRIRDFAQMSGSSSITQEIAQFGVKELGIDEMGLEAIDRKILQVLVEEYEGSPVGLKTLAIAVNESPESLEDFWEQYLIKQGLLQRTSQGRIATKKAWKLLGKVPPNSTRSVEDDKGSLF